MVICVLSFLVWLHHFFTMGASADVNGFFGVMTMIIAVPTGVKVFNWLFTMYGGRVRYTVPVLWSLGFMVTFVIGGMTGVLMAVPPADFQVHNSVFLIAHFHNVIIGGVVFGVMAGFNYWFPKAFGFRLDERWGRGAFWCWLVGFYVAFMPLYALGLMGMTRRLQHYDDKSWQPYLIVAAIGVAIILAGIVCQIIQLIVSIRARNELRVGDDPWNGRTSRMVYDFSTAGMEFFDLAACLRGRCLLERQTTGAAEPRASRSIGQIQADRDAEEQPDRLYQCLLAVVTGFALIWHIWWMAGLGLIGAFGPSCSSRFVMRRKSQYRLSGSFNSNGVTKRRLLRHEHGCHH